MDRWNINLYTNQIQNKFEFTLVYSSVFLFVVVAIIQLLSRVPLFETPWTVAHQVPLPMGSLPARILEWVAMPSSSKNLKKIFFKRTVLCERKIHFSNPKATVFWSPFNSSLAIL